MAKPDYLKVQKKYGRKGLMSRLFLIISRCTAGCECDRKKGFKGSRLKNRKNKVSYLTVNTS